MSACKTTNGCRWKTISARRLWDTPFDLSGKTYTVIKLYQDGTARIRTKRKTASPISSGNACTASTHRASRSAP